MRQNQNSKRSRSRGRRPNGMHQPNFNRNTTFESNGPEGRLRGNAQQLFEKYTALAHDAAAAGERISAEALSQFADHYYRVHQSILSAAEQRRSQQESRDKSNGRADAGDTSDNDAKKATDATDADDAKQAASAETAEADSESEQASADDADTSEAEEAVA